MLRKRSLASSSFILISFVLIGLSSCGRPASQTSIEINSETSSQTTTGSELPSKAETSVSVEESITSEPAEQEPTKTLPSEDFCNSAITQTELNECSYEEYEAADRALNQAYQSLTEQISLPAQEALTTAELAWIEFRDSDCQFVRSQYAGGSIEPLIYHSCLTERTKTRTDELTSTASTQTGNRSNSNQLDYATADTALNQRYQELLAMLSPEDIKAIETVQLSWIDYRDRICTFEANYQNLENTQCLARMSYLRATALENMIEQRSL